MARRRTTCTSAKALKRIPIRELRARPNGSALARLKKKPAAKWTARECELAERALSSSGLGDGGTCPTYTVTCRRVQLPGRPSATRCWASPEGSRRVLGEMVLNPVRDGKHLAVNMVTVDDRYQRCGVGTRLYEAALAAACEQGLRLASDTQRTDGSEGFWQKQVAKGRAQCVSSAPADRLNERWGPEGTWSCGRFAMLETCPSSPSLRGLGAVTPPSGFLEQSVFRRTLYHGSDARRRVLEPQHGSEYGIYLTPSHRYARRYGDRLHEVFVDARNPLIVESKSEISPRDLTEADARRLQAQGYDSIVVSPTGRLEDAQEVVLFEPEQAHVFDVRGLGALDAQAPAPLVDFVRKAAPGLLQRHMFSCYSLKQCSQVAPAFTHLARQHGFNAKTAWVPPGHYITRVETDGGVYEVDLSEVQFIAPPEGEEAFYDFVDDLVAEAKKDVFSVVSLRKADVRMPEDDAYRINDEAIERVRSNFVRDQQAFEETGGEMWTWEQAALAKARQRKGLGALVFDGETMWTDETRTTPWQPKFSAFSDDERINAQVQRVRRGEDLKYALSEMQSMGVEVDPEVLAKVYGPPPEPLKPALFHSAPAFAMTSIKRTGLRPRRGDGLFQHGGYDHHSQGKLFLADNFDAARQWQHKVEMQLFDQYDDERKHDAVMLRVKDRPTELDPVGDRDVEGSRFVTERIPPSEIEFFDGKERRWRPIKEYRRGRAGEPEDAQEAHAGLKGVRKGFRRFRWGASPVR